MTWEGVLFDLDGTLLDSSQDLMSALNALLADYNQPPVIYEHFRPSIAHGGMAMLKMGFGTLPEDTDVNTLREKFFTYYDETQHAQSALFPGMLTVLQYLEEHAIPWGIVSNKHERFTLPAIARTTLNPAIVIAGDTLTACKPHPLPVLHACKQLGCDPRKTLFIGDAEVDVLAGKRANTKTAVANYGFLHPDIDTSAWQADFYVENEEELFDIIG